MLTCENDKFYPSAKTLVRDKVASRLRAKDASLYAYDQSACTCARDRMGWVDLASNPPYPITGIQELAEQVIQEGFTTVLLIGQGGSTQAPMTITKYNKVDTNALDFKVLDSVSPVRVRTILGSVEPERTLVVVSSKSGGTIEMLSVLAAVLDHFASRLPQDEVFQHFVAITDPGSDLEARALAEGWRTCIPGEPSVGGRFSALSVFGLVPAALVGIDLGWLMGHAREAELACSEDSVDNPAIVLASFLYDNYLKGRDKICLLTPKRGRVLGLWIEQLVAESLGKEGTGILPNIEIDPLTLHSGPTDRCAITYVTKTDCWDDRKNFEMSLSYIDPTVPRLTFRIDNVVELAEHFVMWEYAVAMCGYLMRVCPFDQPDVASTKQACCRLLESGLPQPTFTQRFIGPLDMGEAEVTLSPHFDARGLADALYQLLSSLKPGDYFALDAFLPFDGEGRREALETIRHSVSSRLHAASCLEIGPRYLHSTGQLQKGGMNSGVFLLLSAGEIKDIPLQDQKAESLGALEKTQAAADMQVLMERGRRCMHLHLPDNASVTLQALADVFEDAVARVMQDRLDEMTRQAAREQAERTAAADPSAELQEYFQSHGAAAKVRAKLRTLGSYIYLD